MRITGHKIAALLFLFITNSIYAQGKKELLHTFIEKSKSITSVEYNIHQKNAKGKYGFPTIHAHIYQQKADVKDIGFGNAFIKVTGTIKERGKTKNFAFSYDGKMFLFEKGESGIKKYTKPTRKIVMGLLQQHLFMLHIRPFSENNPYSPKSRMFFNFESEDDETIKGKSYHKIKSNLGPTRIIRNGDTIFTKPGRAVDIFWIDKKTKLPKFYTDNFVYKTISVQQINKNYKDAFFSIRSSSKPIKERSYQETQNEIAGNDLLKVNTKVPKWFGVSQNGKKFSSESLKGKVVLIDFWGTWCAPCIKAMPKFETLQQQFKSNKDVVVIGVSAGERDKKKAEHYFKSKGYSYIHIPNGDIIAKIFKVKIYPTTYIINKKGVIVQAAVDYDIDDFERSKRLINEYLKK